MMGSGWLIDDRECAPTVALEVARLHGIKVDRLAFSGEASLAELNAAASLVTISFDHLRHLSPAARLRLKRSVMQGTTLHIKGGSAAPQPIPFAPFADGHLLRVEIAAAGYYLTDHPMLPSALRNEKRNAELSMPAAASLPVVAEPLLVAHGADGKEHPSLFIVRAGKGVVVYDLLPEMPAASIPLLKMLEDPRVMTAGVGAFVAAGIAWKGPLAESQFNIVIDDRPADFDYFNCARALAFLRHLEHGFTEVHVDFAWTPDQSHPSRRYVAALKSFRTGFVWHGLLRHIDHRAISDLVGEYHAGCRLVQEVEATYGVRFQPVMIFPFERDTPQCVEFLAQQGFIGKAQTFPDWRTGNDCAGAVRDAAGASTKGRFRHERFAILERFAASRLTREQMTARALLGLPIIAAAHPHDIGLMRLAGLRPRARGSFAHFDPILRFAAEKHLRPASLEEIAECAIQRA